MNGWVDAEILNLLRCIIKKVNSQSIEISDIDSKVTELLERQPVSTGAIFFGDWNIDIEYNVNYSVAYDGKIYLSLDKNMGVIPTSDATKWRELGTLTDVTNGGNY